MDESTTIVEAARRLPSLERAAYLDRECKGDAARRRLVEEMIDLAEKADAFFKGHETSPGDGTFATVPEGPGTVIGRYIVGVSPYITSFSYSDGRLVRGGRRRVVLHPSMEGGVFARFSDKLGRHGSQNYQPTSVR